MTCHELRDSYELYALGSLEAEERAELDGHLARRCPTCVAGVQRALLTNAEILSLVAELEPPARLRQKIRTAVGVETSRWHWGWTWAFTSLVLLIAALLIARDDRRTGAALSQARQELRATQGELSYTRQVLWLLGDPETQQVGFGQGDVEPRGNVFVNSHAGLLLVASNLPPAPDGKTYEMWLIPKDGPVRPAGLFQSDLYGPTFHLILVAIDPSVTAAVAVSLESGSGSVTPTTIVIPPVTIGALW